MGGGRLVVHLTVLRDKACLVVALTSASDHDVLSGRRSRRRKSSLDLNILTL